MAHTKIYDLPWFIMDYCIELALVFLICNDGNDSFGDDAEH